MKKDIELQKKIRNYIIKKDIEKYLNRKIEYPVELIFELYKNVILNRQRSYRKSKIDIKDFLKYVKIFEKMDWFIFVIQNTTRIFFQVIDIYFFKDTPNFLDKSFKKSFEKEYIEYNRVLKFNRVLKNIQSI